MLLLEGETKSERLSVEVQSHSSVTRFTTTPGHTDSLCWLASMLRYYVLTCTEHRPGYTGQDTIVYSERCENSQHRRITYWYTPVQFTLHYTGPAEAVLDWSGHTLVVPALCMIWRVIKLHMTPSAVVVRCSWPKSWSGHGLTSRTSSAGLATSKSERLSFHCSLDQHTDTSCQWQCSRTQMRMESIVTSALPDQASAGQ